MTFKSHMVFIATLEITDSKLALESQQKFKHLLFKEEKGGPGQGARLERRPLHQKVAGSVSNQGTYPGFRHHPRSGHVQEGGTQTAYPAHIDVCVRLSPPS